ncbi:MAG: hypothetical protein GY717_06595 [Rhodobacteraceae bacterium]|nr:hypothetical protein [Paracoccaceae bacterium]
MKLWISTAAGLLLASAALANGTDVSQPPEIPDTCGAFLHQDLIGQPREAIEALDLPPPVRIIEHGQFVTLEFLPDRINFQLDREGLVERIYCG